MLSKTFAFNILPFLFSPFEMENQTTTVFWAHSSQAIHHLHGHQKRMLPHMTNCVQLIIDFLELWTPELLSAAKGIEIECTVREKQINSNKWQTIKLSFLSEA